MNPAAISDRVGAHFLIGEFVRTLASRMANPTWINRSPRTGMSRDIGSLGENGRTRPSRA
jgi:hypothetical protein